MDYFSKMSFQPLPDPCALFVETNDGATLKMQQVLKKNAYNVRCIRDSGEGIEIIESYKPDLIIADLQAPMIRGDEMLVELKNSGFRHPIILLTDKRDINAGLLSLRHYTFDILIKPVHDTIFLAACEKAICNEYIRLYEEFVEEDLKHMIREYCDDKSVLFTKERVSYDPHRILVIENDIMTANLIERILREQGCHVVISGDAEDALLLIDDRGTDLLIIDLLVPGLDENALFRGLRTRNFKHPILVLTTPIRINDTVVALRYNAFDFLFKPLDEAMLLTCCQKALLRDRERVQREANIKHLYDRLFASSNIDASSVIIDLFETIDRRIQNRRKMSIV